MGSTDEYEDVKDESSDPCVEKLSWIDVDSSRRGSLRSVGKKEFSKRLSKISLLSVGLVCANEPPMVMSRSRAHFMSKPEQKMSKDTSSGIDKFGVDAKRHKNLAQAALMDSYNCSKSRMSIDREFMRVVSENE